MGCWECGVYKVHHNINKVWAQAWTYGATGATLVTWQQPVPSHQGIPPPRWPVAGQHCSMWETVDWYSLWMCMCSFMKSSVMKKEIIGHNSTKGKQVHLTWSAGQYVHTWYLLPFSLLHTQRRMGCHLVQELLLKLLSSFKTRVMASTCHSDYY